MTKTNPISSAFDKDTGKILWRQDRDEPTAWTSPIAVVEEDGKIQIIVSGTNRIRAYDAQTGQVIWQCGGQTQNVIPTPVCGHGIVYCTSVCRSGGKCRPLKPCIIQPYQSRFAQINRS
ncbi:MAG: PQQ-binding-like beta-propeller repeat protein [Planctomycetes bacterium]|nr:PQQ-binding-like beta-propeller repeat protein [Planctomycetota bacterium]